jgi:hypothetical protein
MLARANVLVRPFVWDFRCILGGQFAMPFLNFAEKPLQPIFRNVSKAGLKYFYCYYLIFNNKEYVDEICKTIIMYLWCLEMLTV